MLLLNLFISCVKEAGERSVVSSVIYRAEGLPGGHVLESMMGRTDTFVFFMILIGGWFYKAG